MINFYLLLQKLQKRFIEALILESLIDNNTCFTITQLKDKCFWMTFQIVRKIKNRIYTYDGHERQSLSNKLYKGHDISEPYSCLPVYYS